MHVNRWLLISLLLFIIIETFGYLFWHAADEVCPKCHGTGKVWVPGIPSLGISGYWATCSECGGTGFVWRCSAPASVALYSLFFAFIFFALFFLMYIGDAFYAEMNPWVSTVDRMEWPFNPMYWAWLFKFDRRTWALYRTVISSLLTPLIGAVIFNLLINGKVTFYNSLIGFSMGCAFLAYLALSWYKGFWKPRTREVHVQVPESIEAEWANKKL